MKSVKKEELRPYGDTVIVEVEDSRKIVNGLVVPQEPHSKLNTTFYEGKIVSCGAKCKSNLKGKVLVDKFAGSHVNTKDALVKCYSEDEITITYRDILDRANLYVHGNRVIVELIEDTVSEGGVYQGNISTQNPNEVDMQSGRIIKISKTIRNKDLKVGDTICFDSYVGTAFKDKDLNSLKVVPEELIKYLI